MKTLIIIPAYNESENIERVVNNLIENYPQYDYVVINDGSNDDAANICRKNQFALIDLPLNVGLAGGVQTGMKYACRNNNEFNNKDSFNYHINLNVSLHRAKNTKISNGDF